MCGVIWVSVYIQVDWQLPFLDSDFHKTTPSVFRVRGGQESLSKVYQRPQKQRRVCCCLLSNRKRTRNTFFEKHIRMIFWKTTSIGVCCPACFSDNNDFVWIFLRDLMIILLCICHCVVNGFKLPQGIGVYGDEVEFFKIKIYTLSI